MNNTDKQKIDGMDYRQLLHMWRFAPDTETLLQGDTGEYFGKIMREKKNNLLHDEQVAISKAIGW